jgi:hypothetical protein
MSLWKRFWQVWQKYAHRFGNFQSRMLLTAFYGVVVLPFGLATRLFADPLHIRKLPTHWLEHSDEGGQLRWAKRQ